jgi:transcriptional regulator with XRE-family HTH domain
MNLTTLGSAITMARAEIEMTQAVLARKAGVCVNTVSNLENGRSVSTGTLEAVLQVLGITCGLWKKGGER